MLAEYKAFQNNLSTYCRNLKLSHSLPQVSSDRPCKALPFNGEKKHFLLLRRIFQRIFRHHLPNCSSKQWPSPTNVFLSFGLFSSPSLLSSISWKRRFRNELPEEQPLPLFACNLNTLDLSLALDIRGRFLSAELSTWVHCVAPFQPFLYHPHTPMRKIRASCARKDTLQVGTLLPSFFWYHFFKFSYPNKAGQWVTT